ncbi:hypothetical protein ACLB1O_23165 [Escherichia coli]
MTLDVEEQHQGSVMQALGERKGDLKNMNPDGKGRVRLDYVIPSRGLIGFRSEFMTMTSGTGLLYSPSATTTTYVRVKWASVRTAY